MPTTAILRELVLRSLPCSHAAPSGGYARCVHAQGLMGLIARLQRHDPPRRARARGRLRGLGYPCLGALQAGQRRDSLEVALGACGRFCSSCLCSSDVVLYLIACFTTRPRAGPTDWAGAAHRREQTSSATEARPRRLERTSARAAGVSLHPRDGTRRLRAGGGASLPTPPAPRRRPGAGRRPRRPGRLVPQASALPGCPGRRPTRLPPPPGPPPPPPPPRSWLPDPGGRHELRYWDGRSSPSTWPTAARSASTHSEARLPGDRSGREPADRRNGGPTSRPGLGHQP